MISCKDNKKADNSPKPTLISQDNIDLKNRVIKIYSICDKLTNGEKVEDYLAAQNTQVADLERAKIKRIQDKYNCIFEYAKDDANGSVFQQEYLPSIKKGDPLIDFIVMPEPFAIQFNIFDEKGIFQPLKEYANILELNNDQIWNVQKQNELYPDDNTKVLCANDLYDKFFSNDILFFNKTLLKNAGLSDQYNLEQMQEDKIWTWEVFRKLCIAISKDTNHDGKNDNHGFFYNSTCLNDLALSNGDGKASSLINFDSNGKPEFSILKSAQKGAFDFINDVNKQNCVRLVSDGSKMNPYDESFNSFVGGNDLFYFGNGLNIYELQNKMKDEWGAVAFPIGPDNVSKQYFIANNNTKCFAMARGAKDVGDLAYVLKDFAEAAVGVSDMIDINKRLLTEKGFDSSIISTYELLSRNEALSADRANLFDSSMYNFYLDTNKFLFDKGTDAAFLIKESALIQTSVDDFWKQIAGK